MKARQLIEAEDPKNVFRNLGPRPHQVRKLTNRERERLQTIIGMGPIPSRPSDQKFLDWGYIRYYELGDGSVEVAPDFYNQFCKGGPPETGGVPLEWVAEPPGALLPRGRRGTYHWREALALADSVLEEP